MTVTVECDEWNMQVAIAPGERLLDVLDDRPQIRTPFACRGAHCATCRVRVVAGADALVPALADEAATLRSIGSHPDDRLACQITIGRDGARVCLRASPATAPPR